MAEQKIQDILAGMDKNRLGNLQQAWERLRAGVNPEIVRQFVIALGNAAEISETEVAIMANLASWAANGDLLAPENNEAGTRNDTRWKKKHG